MEMIGHIQSITPIHLRTQQLKTPIHLSPPTDPPGLGSSTVDQVLKYTKYPKYIPSTSTGQVLI